MKTKLIAIGNSKGVRIPGAFIKQCGLTREIEIDIRDRTIIISSPQGPRAGWKQAFEQMARQGDDSLLDPAAAAWDDDWLWPYKHEQIY